MELLLKNGFVFDPINEINGEKMDIAIRNGKIVESVNDSKAKKIDATGLTVMPGGVDIHTHIAGGEVNTGRLLRPEDHVKDGILTMTRNLFPFEDIVTHRVALEKTTDGMRIAESGKAIRVAVLP